jgi:plasmid maintenance system killer protein
MRFAFASDELESIYDTGASQRFHPHLVRALFSVLTRIAAASDERDLRAS